jgi:hypothetical protein
MVRTACAATAGITLCGPSGLSCIAPNVSTSFQALRGDAPALLSHVGHAPPSCACRALAPAEPAAHGSDAPAAASWLRAARWSVSPHCRGPAPGSGARSRPAWSLAALAPARPTAPARSMLCALRRRASVSSGHLHWLLSGSTASSSSHTAASRASSSSSTCYKGAPVSACPS